MSDRDLDRQVAEKVMGWVRQHKIGDDHCHLNGPNWKNTVGTWVAHAALRNGDGGLPLRVTHGVPYFSSDISAAWLVVEAMREKGFTVVTLHTWVGGWRAGFQRRSDGKSRSASVRDEALPRAICLAALRAMGGEVGE